MRLAVIGAGGIGGPLGTSLLKAGKRSSPTLTRISVEIPDTDPANTHVTAPSRFRTVQRLWMPTWRYSLGTATVSSPERLKSRASASRSRRNLIGCPIL